MIECGAYRLNASNAPELVRLSASTAAILLSSWTMTVITHAAIAGRNGNCAREALPAMTEPMHIIPINDLREHVSSNSCWCHPEQDDEQPSIWVHNSMDRREEYEEGRKPS